MRYYRSASLRGFRAVVAELGGDAEDLAARAGVPVGCLDEDDLLVPGAASAAMLELAAEQLDCPVLGLRTASRQSLSLLGPLAVAIANAPTFKDVLETIQRYLYLHMDFGSVGFGQDPQRELGMAAFTYGPVRRSGPRQSADLSLGFVHRSFLYISGGDYGLRGVHLPYPPGSEPDAYSAFYGVPVTFDSGLEVAALRVPADILGRSMGGIDHTIRQLALAHLDRVASHQTDAAVYRIRAVVQELLNTGSADQSAVAAVLSLSPRTLQRRLAAHGTTYAEILDEARKAKAFDLITGTSMPIGYVAALCGFAEHSSFSKAARRWWKTSAKSLRQAKRSSRSAGESSVEEGR
ncbi:AraC family transcriptional regulator [Streptomyces sp. NPDC088921]|uniref:AraC family transcriptional regulator n=1 Tax=unclassified Streptomyces TaxID=2593676 RepID=UPI0034487071